MIWAYDYDLDGVKQNGLYLDIARDIEALSLK